MSDSHKNNIISLSLLSIIVKLILQFESPIIYSLLLLLLLFIQFQLFFIIILFVYNLR